MEYCGKTWNTTVIIYGLRKMKNLRTVAALRFSGGSGRRIRTLTDGVRVRSATVTQSRCVHEKYSLAFTVLSSYFSMFSI